MTNQNRRRYCTRVYFFRSTTQMWVALPKLPPPPLWPLIIPNEIVIKSSQNFSWRNISLLPSSKVHFCCDLVKQAGGILNFLGWDFPPALLRLDLPRPPWCLSPCSAFLKTERDQKGRCITLCWEESQHWALCKLSAENNLAPTDNVKGSFLFQFTSAFSIWSCAIIAVRINSNWWKTRNS